MSKKSNFSVFRSWIISSVWAFPLTLFLLVIILTSLKISGSSIGMYHNILYGSTVKDPNLVFGKPRAIRSDEWIGTTPLTISQERNGFPQFNQDINTGREVSTKSDIPALNWTAIFKPHMWSYYVLPLEQAFAFRWWSITYLLIVAGYFLFLRITKAKIFSIILSLAFGLSPFLLWWYQAGATLTLAYGFLIILWGMKIIDKDRLKHIKNERFSDLASAGIIGYLLSCFALVFYPPYQIPVALVVASYLLGYSLSKFFGKKYSLSKLSKRLGVIIFGAFIAATVSFVFVTTHQASFKALSESVYPGHRTVSSGGLPMLNIFDAFLMPVFQSDSRGANYFLNQSEASNFILIMPFLIIPALLIVFYEYKKRHKIDWVFVSIIVCCLLFLARAFVHYGNPFYKLLLLHRVPHQRLMIGVGFAGILLTVLIYQKLKSVSIPKRQIQLMAIAYGAVCFSVVIAVGLHSKDHYPLFISNILVIIGLALFFVSIIVLLLAKKPIPFACMLLLFTLFSGFYVNPLYRGLDMLTKNKAVERIEQVSTVNDDWVVIDDGITFETFPLLANRRTYSGKQLYPDLSFWSQIDKGKNEKIYNRQAHVQFSTNMKSNKKIELISNSTFRVKFECTNFIKDNVEYALATYPVNLPCVELVEKIPYPRLTFNIYRIIK